MMEGDKYFTGDLIGLIGPHQTFCMYMHKFVFTCICHGWIATSTVVCPVGTIDSMGRRLSKHSEKLIAGRKIEVARSLQSPLLGMLQLKMYIFTIWQ